MRSVRKAQISGADHFCATRDTVLPRARWSLGPGGSQLDEVLCGYLLGPVLIASFGCLRQRDLYGNQRQVVMAGSCLENFQPVASTGFARELTLQDEP